jgi:hypothetical protein
MVTRMAPQRQVAEMDCAKEEEGWELGLPVNFEEDAMIEGVLGGQDKMLEIKDDCSCEVKVQVEDGLILSR